MVFHSWCWSTCEILHPVLSNVSNILLQSSQVKRTVVYAEIWKDDYYTGIDEQESVWVECVNVNVCKYHIIHSPHGFSGIIYNTGWGTLPDCLVMMPTCPTLYEECVGSLTSHRFITCARACETGTTVYRPYPRRLESLIICRCHYKVALSSQLFKDPECWFGRGLNPRPPAQQAGALPTELTRRRFIRTAGKPIWHSTLTRTKDNVDMKRSWGHSLRVIYAFYAKVNHQLSNMFDSLTRLICTLTVFLWIAASNIQLCSVVSVYFV